MYDASYVFSTYRYLPAAIRALRDGDDVPMLRLAAADAVSLEGAGRPHAYSAGHYVAVSCHDYPAIWDVRADVGERRKQLDAAVARLDLHAFAPFPNDVWLKSKYESELVSGCLGWPRPRVSDPAFPPDLPHPDVPVLVLNGDLDVTTPSVDARRAARSFPNATFLQIPNEIHVAALYDFHDCASAIVQRFLLTLRPGDTSCLSKLPAVAVLPRFPATVAAAPEADPAGPADASTAPDRRASWVAAQTVGDAFDDWYNQTYAGGTGLRGGRFSATGGYLSEGPLVLRLRRLRFTEDLVVSGRAVWNRRAHRVTARLKLVGAGQGSVVIRFPTIGLDAVATIEGTVGGSHVDLAMPAPWAP